ncbi:MAG: MBL fold metallo-hydrolase [Anaerolineae bacterium]|nr:MBL fold metallo-hydrolase [Anaerolineae bacterium]
METSSPTVISISLGFVSVFLLKGETRSILVDAGVRPGDAAKILDQIRAHGIDPRSISLIAITHVHPDHVGALSELVKATSARVAVHAVEANFLRHSKSQVVVPKSALIRLLMRFAPGAGFSAIEPDVIVEDELNLAPFGVDGKAISTPGHSDGSLSIRLASGEVIVGDLIMSNFILPRKPTFPLIVQNPAQAVESIKRVLSWQPTQIYAAHGGPFTAQAVAKRLEKYLQ